MLRALMVVGIVVCLASACGGQSDETSYQSPPPSNAPTWDQVAAVIQSDCAGCHNGTKEPMLTPEATFRASPVKAKLQAGAMPPPPKTISDADKNLLLAFLGG